MIDLHMHSTHSDGKNTIEELLVQAQNLNLSAISLTDHDTISGYGNLASIRHKFSGKILLGCEINCLVDDWGIEIHAYGFDLNKLFKTFKPADMALREPILSQIMVDVFKEVGLNANLLPHEISTTYAGDTFYKLIELNPDFLKTNPHLKSYKDFYRHELTNPSSKFFRSFKSFVPNYLDVIKHIHECGGLAFLAHPFEYGDRGYEILNACYKQLDGIECYHPSADFDKQNYLLDFCKQKNLLISGGSDYHGHRGTMGSQNVPDELLKQFKNKMFV